MFYFITTPISFLLQNNSILQLLGDIKFILLLKQEIILGMCRENCVSMQAKNTYLSLVCECDHFTKNVEVSVISTSHK